MGQAPPYAPSYEANEVGQLDHQHNMMSQQQLQHQQHDAAPQQHPEQHRAAPQHQHQHQHQHQQQMGHHHNGAEQKWHASYCGFCSPFDLCMKAWCCPCFVYGKTKHRMQSNGNMNGYDSMNSSCFLFCGALCCGLAWIPLWINRSDMRQKHNLEGNGCTDCLSVCCCPLCDIVQQEKESEAREAGGYGKPVVAQYQAQGGMAYPAPVQKH